MSVEQDPALKTPEPIEQLESPTPAVILERTRHEMAQAHGLDVDPQPVELSAEQEAQVLEGFVGTVDERLAKAKLDARQAGFDEGIVADWHKKRYSTSALAKIRSAEPGDTISVMNPREMLFSGNPVNDRVAASAGFAVAERAVVDAAKALGSSEADLARFESSATAQVFSSPHNGAPLITQRTIELPEGTIHEMALHGAGSTDVIDSQVVVTKK